MSYRILKSVILFLPSLDWPADHFELRCRGVEDENLSFHERVRNLIKNVYYKIYVTA
jgi:hypothetical protein